MPQVSLCPSVFDEEVALYLLKKLRLDYYYYYNNNNGDNNKNSIRASC